MHGRLLAGSCAVPSLKKIEELAAVPYRMQVERRISMQVVGIEFDGLATLVANKNRPGQADQGHTYARMHAIAMQWNATYYYLAKEKKRTQSTHEEKRGRPANGRAGFHFHNATPQFPPGRRGNFVVGSRRDRRMMPSVSRGKWRGDRRRVPPAAAPETETDV